MFLVWRDLALQEFFGGVPGSARSWPTCLPGIVQITNYGFALVTGGVAKYGQKKAHGPPGTQALFSPLPLPPSGSSPHRLQLQIFLGSDPLLDLPGLVRYRISGEDMGARLKRLEAAGGPVVLRLVEHMVQRDASKRKTVQVPSFGAFVL